MIKLTLLRNSVSKNAINEGLKSKLYKKILYKLNRIVQLNLNLKMFSLENAMNVLLGSC